jgi:hypothetical protein
VQAAIDPGREDGNKPHVDTTVVQSDIHHPRVAEGLQRFELCAGVALVAIN